MKQGIEKVIRFVKLIFFPLVVTVAGYFLWQEMRQVHIKDIVHSLYSLTPESILLALMLTGFNYFILAGYDLLALRFSGHTVKSQKAVFASFFCYAFSYNFGFLIGGAFRSRIYNALGLTVTETTKVISFLFLTFWLGFCTLAGFVFLFSSRLVSVAPSFIPLLSTRSIGVILLSLVTLFLIWTAGKKRELVFVNRSWELPRSMSTIVQIILASADWLVAAGVLYALLNPYISLSYLDFLGLFLLAQFVAIISHIPGGVGVFESVIILLLPTTVPSISLISVLLVYRVIYYLLPLLIAIFILGVREIIVTRHYWLKDNKGAVGRVVSSTMPLVLTYTTYLAGIILLVSGSLPAQSSRLAVLRIVVPLPTIELSHFLGSVVGVFLLFLARLIRSRVVLAYYTTIALLCFGIVFSLLKGLDYEEAIILVIMLVAFLPSRHYFYRRDSLFAPTLTYGWVISIALTIFATIWLGLFAFKHIEYSNQLWWTFALYGDAPRFLRASVGVIAILLLLGGLKLFRSSPVKPKLPSKKELLDVARLVVRSKRTMAYLGLLGDKYILFNHNKSGFVMYGIENKSAISLGDPIASNDEERQELAWQFHSYCAHQGLRTVFYQITPDNIPLYLDMGLSPLKIGEEALVDVQGFTLKGGQKKSLRYIKKQFEDNGYGFSFIPVSKIDSFLPHLRSISDAWVSAKNVSEKGFSLGFFSEDYLNNFPIATVQDSRGHLVAFANVLLGADKYEVSIDLMRYNPQDSPRDVMTYLFIKIIEWSKDNNYEWFNLGMAPLSGIYHGELAPLWNKASNVILRHGEHFYNFEGLRTYKEKFHPKWESRYLVSSSSFSSVLALKDVAIIVSGGVRGIIGK